ncbi:MAG: hypothetical protein WC385_01370 [Candidatus Paceibacterota bacterium]|jgi:hypothetical protein
MKKLLSSLFVATIALLSLSTFADSNPFEGCWWVAEKTQILYWEDGVHRTPFFMNRGLLENPSANNDGWVFFSVGEEYYFLESNYLTNDPRQTEWWEISRQSCQAKTLWGRVADAARSQDRPEITQLIIAQMIRTGVITEQEVEAGKMTTKRLNQIMLKYSEQVWD